jgi:hypothetical protein
MTKFPSQKNVAALKSGGQYFVYCDWTKVLPATVSGSKSSPGVHLLVASVDVISSVFPVSTGSSKNLPYSGSGADSLDSIVMKF